MSFDIETVDTDALLAGTAQLTDRLRRAEQELGELEVTGRDRDGAVTVTVRGTGTVVRVAIDPDAKDEYDADELGEAVLEALDAAFARCARQFQERVGDLLPEVQAYDA